MFKTQARVVLMEVQGTVTFCYEARSKEPYVWRGLEYATPKYVTAIRIILS